MGVFGGNRGSLFPHIVDEGDLLLAPIEVRENSRSEVVAKVEVVNLVKSDRYGKFFVEIGANMALTVPNVVERQCQVKQGFVKFNRKQDALLKGMVLME